MKFSLFSATDFTVVSCTPELFRGALFQRQNGRWQLNRYASMQKANADEPACSLLKRLQKELNCSKGQRLFLTGELARSVVFTRPSVDLSPRDQRSAVEMELNSCLPCSMEEPMLQFTESSVPDENGEVALTVCAFPSASLGEVAQMLTGANCKADEFIHPLMGVQKNDPPLFFKEFHRDYCFLNGAWKPRTGREELQAPSLAGWKEIFSALFQIPENFPLEEYLEILLIARLELSGKAVKDRPSLKLLPEKLRPLRYRHQLELSGALILLLILLLAGGNFSNWRREYQNYQELQTKCQQCRKQINAIRSKLKRNQKNIREMSRVAELRAGEDDVLARIAALSRVLPDNVQVVNFRLSDSGVDLMLQSENANLNLPMLLKPLNFWKIAQLQQRQMWNSDVTSINLRLVPNDEKPKAAKNAKKTGKRPVRRQTK